MAALLLPMASSSAVAIGTTGLAFEPVTSLIAAGIGMTALGQYQAGQAAAAQAAGQQAMAEYNAKVAEQQAKTEELRSQYESRRQAEAAERYKSELAAGIGASGVVSSEGTPLLIQARQAAEAELDNLMIGYEGQTAASRARSQAALDKMQAGIYGTASRNASMAGMMGAGTSLLTGFGQYYGRKYGYL